MVKAWKRIDSNQYDTEAWSVLMREAQVNKRKRLTRHYRLCKVRIPKVSSTLLSLKVQRLDDARDTYEKLVSTFPSSGKYWRIYIEREVSVIALFSCC